MVDYGVDLICCREEGKEEQLSIMHLSAKESSRLIQKYHDKAYDQNAFMFKYVLWMCEGNKANKVIEHCCYPKRII